MLSEAAQSFCASGQHLYFLVSWLFEANDMHTTDLLFGVDGVGEEVINDELSSWIMGVLGDL